jgi:hypothetical protein
MLDFLEELVGGRKLDIPLYYCKLGVIELEAGFLVQNYLPLSFFRMHRFIVFIVSVSCGYLCVNFSLFFLMCRVWIRGLALPTSLV